eukprot:CAMPEP_0171272980 /NCGR_PEP_ID=MMETSP0790-20130122/62040_1 /TAXON_ID=2925 /ORGANISM="Alexandrium catenella, Strain OF101" /LENGTH=84 /DNA_ID=CAMNT_0011741937 /DNA_START=262 /DNA_END=513 /DNA_ORIENTATION=+
MSTPAEGDVPDPRSPRPRGVAEHVLPPSLRHGLGPIDPRHAAKLPHEYCVGIVPELGQKLNADVDQLARAPRAFDVALFSAFVP